MIPVLFKLGTDSPTSQLMVFVVALSLLVYATWAGWRGAVGPLNRKTGEFAPPTRDDRLKRAGAFAAIALVLDGIGLFYALPSSIIPGGRGEGLPIHTYGVMLATGFISAVMISAALARKEWRGEEGEKKRDQVMDLAFWVLIAGIAGSRILFIIVNWKDYAKNPGDIFSLGGGLVFYGGLIGAMIASFVFTRINKIDFMRLGDIAMPTVSLGQCFGRLGCFSAGCCWGDVAHEGFALGAHFPGAGLAKNLFGQLENVSSLAASSQATDPRWVVPATGDIIHQKVDGAVRISEWVAQHGHTLPVHPTQIYESVGQFILFGSLLFLRRYRRFHGQILGIWLMAYAVLRTTVELFRGDVERGTLHGLLADSLGFTALADKVPLEAWYNISTSQFIAACMFTLGATILYRRSRALMAADKDDGAGLAPAAA